MSYLAEEVNSKSENIGARRLHTIMEKVLDDISFEADEHSGETITIDAEYVDKKVSQVANNEDLSRYILLAAWFPKSLKKCHFPARAPQKRTAPAAHFKAPI